MRNNLKTYPVFTALPDAVNTLLSEQLPSTLYQHLVSYCQKIECLTEGLSNQNFVLYCPTATSITDFPQAFVLRVNDNQASWCHREDEVFAWQQAAAQNIAPRLYFHSQGFEVYLSQYIQQDTQWQQYYQEYGAKTYRKQTLSLFSSTTKPVDLLLSLLTQLGQLPLPQKHVCYQQQWQQYQHTLADYYQSIVQHAPIDNVGGDKSNHQDDWLKCYQKLQQITPHCLLWFKALDACLLHLSFCHRDLTPFNVLLQSINPIDVASNETIDTQALVCIDFEYSAASHPLFDLATIIATHQLSAEQVNYLKSRYFNWQFNQPTPKLTTEAIECVDHAVNCYWVFACMWTLLIASKGRFEYLDYFEHYFELIDLSSI
ncbi:phosphotransferase [Shewanella gaetbuli]|uniref:Phosphotransferase n=1 Tax=Shewanella gaetbuli TaxID=220752 RepID=A0A9X1ZL33_9GAMM|nr:phosphotransferase [Shewanella gaetbuli]MCL1144294.1 phosphotransferase [Shewanella gaetbuli]